MSTNLIGPELEKTRKLAKDKNVNKEKEREESKVYNYKEDRAYITSIKNKNDIVNASITSIKKKYDVFYEVEEERSTSVCNRRNKITQL